MRKTIIYDGECSLCLGVVRFIRRYGKKADFELIPQQSAEGASLTNKYLISSKDTNSVIYLSDGKYFLRSSAVLHILNDMGGWWSLFYVFILVPPFLRDALYRLIAKYRKFFFNQRVQNGRFQQTISEKPVAGSRKR